LAKKLWPGQSALGRKLRLGPFEGYWEIVGVVADVHQRALDQPAEEMVYYPALRGPAERPVASRQMDLVVRVKSGDPMALLPVVRREIAALIPRIPVATPRTMDEVVASSTARASFTMVMLASAA